MSTPCFEPEKDDRYIVTPMFLMVFSLLMIIIGSFYISDCNRYNEIKNSKCKVVGTVVSYGNNVQYKYTVDGKEFFKEKSTRGIPSNLKINTYDTFWVYYDCNDPNSSIMNFDERYTDTIPPADETK